MCGICGLIGIGDEYALSRMSQVLHHRGPDYSGLKWFTEQSAGLGHRRLSIIDLSPAGHQPMSDDEGNLWITFNGEIYNYKEIRAELAALGYPFRSQCDTEVVLAAYKYLGAACLEKFNGIFAFGIYNQKTGELFAARDRLGVKPFYYYHRSDGFVFASEIKSILASGLAPNEPDWESLYTPTRYQLAPFTGFKNIFSLAPGHYFTYKSSELNITRYWDLHVGRSTISEKEGVEKAEQLLLQSVSLQMTADVEVGSFLSGGLDSSLISVLMKQKTHRRIKTFTIKFRDIDQKFERMPDDSRFARQVAQQFDFDHHEILIEPDMVQLLPKLIYHLDEPVADPAAINTFLISRAAREKGIIVLLNGMGADEVWGGYRKHLACLRADLYQSVFPERCRSLIEKTIARLPVASTQHGIRSLRWLKRFFSFASLPRYERYLASDLSLSIKDFQQFFLDGPFYNNTWFYRHQASLFSDNQYDYLTQMCLADTLFYLPQHNLLYCDKASMAAGVESRPPFTDHKLVEFAFMLQSRLRIKNNKQKYLLKQVAKKYLPLEIVNRPKAPFGSPLRSWIRGSLREMVDDYLSPERISKRGLYNPKTIAEKIRLDRLGIEDNAHLIWQLLTMEIWFETFFG